MVYRQVLSDGSSTMRATGLIGFMSVYKSTTTRKINELNNFAQDGSLLSDLIGRLSFIASTVHIGGWNGIVCQIGANDLLPINLSANHSNSVNQWASDTVTNYLIPLALVTRPIICTTLQPRNFVGFNTNRNLANPIIKGWVTSGYIDGIIDFAADSTMGPDAACNDTNLYSDGTHPTQLGQNNDGEITRLALDPWIPGDVIGRLNLKL